MSRFAIKRIRSNRNKLSLQNILSSTHANVHFLHSKKIILIKSVIFIYGQEATKAVAKQMSFNINWHWNYPKATTLVRGKVYKVRFLIVTLYYPRLPQSIVKANAFQSNLFVRIEPKTELGVSLMDSIGANTGFFMLPNIAYKGSSTEAHEYGHALGLWPGTATGHPIDTDYRGKGIPGIMHPRGTLVDANLQYKPEVPAGEPGGTLHPDFRRVNQHEINVLMSLIKQHYFTSQATLGVLTNWYRTHDNQRV
jgi:hypothetical protein